MRRSLAILTLSLALLCAGCGENVSEGAETPEALVPPELSEKDGPAESEEVKEDSIRLGEEVLLTLEAPLADGRTLTLEAVGKHGEGQEMDSCGVRVVRVLDGETLLQTVPARDAIMEEWGEGMLDDFYDYTSCWSLDGTMTTLDLNFDGNTDFGLFGWSANNMIPYYYWTWNAEEERYQFTCTLQGVTLYPDDKTITAEYKDGWAAYITDYFTPDENGELRMTQRIAEYYGEDPDAGPSTEVWMVRSGAAVRPRPYGPQEGDLELAEP